MYVFPSWARVLRSWANDRVALRRAGSSRVEPGRAARSSEAGGGHDFVRLVAPGQRGALLRGCGGSAGRLRDPVAGAENGVKGRGLGGLLGTGGEGVGGGGGGLGGRGGQWGFLE